MKSELVMAAAGIKGYWIESKGSKVYGTTLDVVDSKSGLELASGATGPHKLDKAWGVTDTWVMDTCIVIRRDELM